MAKTRSKQITKTLAQREVHEKWKADYRTEDNTAFYEEAFDYIRGLLTPPRNALILDAGCGTGAHSIRLAKRGFSVRAIDFSEPALEEAKENVRAAGLADHITFQREDLLSLSFNGNTFDYALCWGVLMHIQEIDKAIYEIARVLKPGGYFIVSEGNMNSLESLTLRTIKAILRKERATLERTEAGLEYWTKSSAGTLVTRQADMKGLTNVFRRQGFALKKRTAGQFTELYTRFQSPGIRRTIHALNHLWFRFVKLPYPAFGNILIFQKSAS